MNLYESLLLEVGARAADWCMLQNFPEPPSEGLRAAYDATRWMWWEKALAHLDKRVTRQRLWTPGGD